MNYLNFQNLNRAVHARGAQFKLRFNMKETGVTSQSSSNPEDFISFPTTVTDEYISGEIVFLWSAREHSKHLMSVNEAEMLQSDATLGELFFRQKRKLCRLGRNGGWLQWLKENGISRSTADRLALEYAEFYGLVDKLVHRTIADPIEGRICQAAHRTASRLNKFLSSPVSRMNYVRVLADLLDLRVDWEGETVRLSISPPGDEEKWKNVLVPNVIVIRDDGTPMPVDYELKSADEVESPL
jgi:hypothetical protein